MEIISNYWLLVLIGPVISFFFYRGRTSYSKITNTFINNFSKHGKARNSNIFIIELSIVACYEVCRGGLRGDQGGRPSQCGKMDDYIGNLWSITGVSPLLGSRQWVPTFLDPPLVWVFLIIEINTVTLSC